MGIHIVFLESGVLVSKKTYADWREIQEDFSDYKASLGPWKQDEVVEWLEFEYSNLSPSASEQIRSLMSSDSESVELAWHDTA